MPIYLFACEDCGRTYEIQASMQDKEAGLKPNCPDCDSERSRQLIATSFSIRKGSGDSTSGCNPGSGCCGS